MTATPRIAPLEPPFTPALAEMLAKWMPPGSPVTPLALFRTIAHHDVLREKMRPLGAALLGRGLLPARVRELLILRTTARNACAYEWGVHAAAFGALAGLDRATIDATWILGRVVATDDALILRAADELHDTGTLTDDTYAPLSSRFDAPALLELMSVCGFYHLISFIANAARVPLEPWALRPPT
ncbi:MAG TPA: carboxymuconolactone decarboxylase family protein [Kofleriaceae bacterium]|nr:carboxymuconolactone decarboxylase family protein [Kofleriaceae bacterium]